MSVLSRRRGAEAPTQIALSESVKSLCDAWGLSLSSRGALEGDGVAFVKLESHPDIDPPQDLPSIRFGDDVYFLVPSDAELFEHLRKYRFPGITDAAVITDGVAYLGPDELAADDLTISYIIGRYLTALSDADEARKSRELLDRELSATDLYASRAPIDEVPRMLVDGFMRERGVSVFYGQWNEFKTTVVLDIVAHIAMGVPWQGRAVKPLPVVWFALEGADEIPIRLRALETRLSQKSPAWGDYSVPITCRDRLPEDQLSLRAELHRIFARHVGVHEARSRGSMTKFSGCWEYSDDGESYSPPVVVIDTLSLALGHDDEKGPKAAGFIADCLDLLKRRDDLADNDSGPDISAPAASHVIIIHHQTKTGVEFAGHRAIAGHTQGLYRVHRFGRITDKEQPYSGQITPYRTKGMARPAPIRFEVDVVDIEGTKQTAVLLKDKSAALPADFEPALAQLRTLDSADCIAPADLNECLDAVAAADGRTGAAVRKYRQRMREQLIEAGALEPIETDDGKLLGYRFTDPGAAA